MQHCTQPTYLSDHFCEECGDEIDNKTSLKTIEECAPDCLTEVKQYFPNAEIGTGVVESVYFYKRRYKDKENDLIYSYCWVTMSQANGEKMQYSVSAENSLGANLKIGDVITLFRPYSWNLAHKFYLFEDSEIVTHDGFVDFVINHHAEEQISASGGRLKPSEKRRPELFIITLIIVPILAYFFIELSLDNIVNVAIVSAVLTFVSWFIEWTNISNKHEKKVVEFETIEDAFSLINSVTRQQLGYENLHRIKRDNDVICIHCQSRIASDAGYCHQCGSAQVQVVPKSEQSLNCDVDVSNTQADSVVVSSAPVSIKDLEDEIKEEYALEYQAPFEYANFYSKNYSGTMNVESVIGKVIDKKVAADVSDATTITTKTKTTTADYYNRNGGFVRTDKDVQTSKSQHRARSAGLLGLIVLSTAHGVISLRLPEQQIKATDIGDWMYYEDCEITTNEDGITRPFRLTLRNLTKNSHYDTQGIDFSEYTVIEERLPKVYNMLAIFSTVPVYFISEASDFNLYAWPEAINDFFGAPLNGFFMFFYPYMLYFVFLMFATAVKISRKNKSIDKFQNSLSKSEKLTDKLNENLKKLREKFALLS